MQGFGLVLAEAMARGKVALATAWSLASVALHQGLETEAHARAIAPTLVMSVNHRFTPGTAAFSADGIDDLAALPPLSLYVHLPWCLKKCPYCDFNSHEAKGEFPEQRYLDALRADLESSLPLIWGRSVHSVFIGGGTPSLFSPDAIDRLLSDVRALLRLEADTEITLEANPGTFEKDRFKAVYDVLMAA